MFFILSKVSLQYQTYHQRGPPLLPQASKTFVQSNSYHGFLIQFCVLLFLFFPDPFSSNSILVVQSWLDLCHSFTMDHLMQHQHIPVGPGVIEPQSKSTSYFINGCLFQPRWCDQPFNLWYSFASLSMSVSDKSSDYISKTSFFGLVSCLPAP